MSRNVATKGVAGKVRRIKQSLDAIERGSYSEFDIYRCCDYIGWLAKFKKVPEETWRQLCEQATRILETGLDR